MRLNKRNIRAFWKQYRYMAFPRVADVVLMENFKDEGITIPFLLTGKEFVVILGFWFAVFSQAGQAMIAQNIHLNVMSLLVWILVSTLISFAFLPIVQSPLKFLRFIWDEFIPDPDEENEKPKRGKRIRITDDGELEQYEDDTPLERIEEYDPLELTEEKVKKIKRLANQQRQ